MPIKENTHIRNSQNFSFEQILVEEERNFCCFFWISLLEKFIIKSSFPNKQTDNEIIYRTKCISINALLHEFICIYRKVQIPYYYIKYLKYSKATIDKRES